MKNTSVTDSFGMGGCSYAVVLCSHPGGGSSNRMKNAENFE